ncbi:MAG: hypothetical protein E6J70_17805 [Deltaproteobacteria bacterium]|nr:MAG: hypothetical protein E6J70_17805 [Deltaproteobacteria bacterium]TMB44489.1 MAG: hypothetical protein E6J55_09170 [Deltaproteobacteria bacterium]
MATFLRALGVLVLVLGLAAAAVAGWLLAGDAHFQEVAAAYGRHPEHALFQAEYWAAALRHYGLLAAMVAGLLGGLSLGGILLALGQLLRRVS